MKEPAPKMKDSASITSNMINRNWVLKRKRRKIPSAQEKVNGNKSDLVPLECDASTSPRGKLNNYITSDRSSKKKGNDGYYYECVICDLGGNLLCCDSCPRTYHLQCLDPPLKRIPNGKWQCPNCCLKNKPVETIDNLDPISKRARTKIVVGKSKTGIKSAKTDKISRIFGSSIPGKKETLVRGKSSLPASSAEVASTVKSSHPCDDRSPQGSSSFSNADSKNENNLSPTEALEETKSVSPVKSVVSPPRVLEVKTSEETSDNKCDLSGSGQSPGKKDVPILDEVLQGARKRKRKIPLDYDAGPVKGKKLRTDKGKDDADSSQKRGTKARLACSGKNKPKRKRKEVEPGKSLSKTDAGRRSADIQLEDKMMLEEDESPSQKFLETGKVVGKSTHADHDLYEGHQVDRVLGCRIQSNQMDPVHHIIVSHSNDMPVDSLPNVGNQIGPPENSICNTTSHVGDTEIHVESGKDIVSHVDGATIVHSDKGVEKMSLGKSAANNPWEHNSMDAVEKAIKDPDSEVTKDSSEVASASRPKPLPKSTEQMIMGDNYSAGLSHQDDLKVTQDSEKPISPDISDNKGLDVEITINSSNKKKEEAIVAESISSCKGTVSYEFLVKWVGKSHIHNSWVSESQLKVLAKRKLDNYKAKYGMAVINICDERWKLPQRVIALKPSTHGSAEVLVKWTGLPYDECTWEKIDEPVVAKSSHLIDLFNQFEQQTIEKDAAKYNSLKGKGQAQQTDIVTLTEQPKELLGGSLFPHQLEALNWLRKCWYKSKNVILADEMGLGKTVSACAFISSLYFEFKARLPCLVLVPLSTMPNWMAEFSLWAPNLNVVEYHGCAKARALIRQYEWHANNPNGSNKKIQSYKFHVLLTTYEMVLADASHLRLVPWEVLVVDEGHRLKNSGSKLFSLLNMFSFQHRVLLTGTPLQNNIGEMYNLLNFLQPASFPSLASFEEKFNDLTTAEKVDELKKLVAPHMLRRLKKDAMQNIPPKTERMVPVELSSIQAEYYRAMLTKNYQILRNMGKGVPQQSMLNIVMQLRKVCNHPYLIPGTEPESGSSEFLHDMRIKASAKLSLLHSMLKILHKEGHRVLIFSQMTKLLDILEDYLNIEFGPKTFERVDGSVSVADRQTAIARFNQDKSRFVFLLSTRSCGLGINLATADTVIIYDSDFNPHADIQAMNRAHRIGQSSRLLVYRLVVRASVEERILQLARKKLMLDQLFVNKSGSQKEVEDILRWGTEELFNDSSINAGKDLGENQSKGEVLIDTEHKHKRRTGGLGDVYQDKCTDGNSKIVWDESAILKLLDRSNLHSTLTENAEGDSENDMLGSVKSIEWNEEPTEEQEGNESLPIVTDDISALNSDKKEEKSDSATEENEWDRLLRVRWEKYQSEEEAALGRGKRQRKAVSYREAYAPNSIETLSEQNGANEEPEPEPEPEPEREYTPAGRALKTKFAMLRARQKERLAQRSALKASGPIEVPPGAESFLLLSSAQDGNQISRMDHPVGGKILAVDAEDMHDQMLDVPKSKTEPTLRVGKAPRHKLSGHFNFPIQPFPNQSMDIFLPSQHVQATSFPNTMPSNNLLPVLGLCAPNATQFESSQRNRSHRHSRQGIGLEFPFHISPFPGTSNEIDAKGRETVSNKFKMPDAATETLQRGPKTSILDRLPFNSHNLGPMQGKGAEASENSGDTFSNGYQNLTFPKLPFDESFLPKLPFPARNPPQPQPDLFPSLSLGSTVADSNNSLQEIPMIPFLPNLKFPKETSVYNQGGREVPPLFDLGQMPPKFSAFPENHRKVLENIMMRTGSGSSKLLKKKLVKDTWSEEELDSLWIGVRRHGRGSWDLMLLDPRLKFSKQRTAEDLSARWEEEQLKITEPIQKPSKVTKSGKSPLFPSISDGMMKRALHRSRFAGPMNFHSHLTEMKLGFGDLTSSLQQLEASNKHLPPIPAWHSDRFHPSLMGESSSGPSDRPGTSSNMNTEHPFLLNSFGTTSLNSLGLNGPNSFDGLKFPNIFDNSINMLRESGNSTGSGLAGPSSNKEESIPNLKGGDDLGGGSSSSENKLPHWLRKAVGNAPSAQPPQPELPPTVSAIAHSIRLLYGDENPTIPPFVAPGLPPAPPKDPRCSFLKNKKKKKRKKHRQHTLHDGLPDIPGISHPLESSNLDGLGYGASTSALASPPLLPPLQLASEISGGPSRIEADLNILPGSPNTLDGSSDVPQLVTNPCTNPDPVPGTISPSLSLEENKEVPLPNSSDQGRKMDSTGSGVSSKTQSDPSTPDPTVEGEISSEGTVSDHHVSEDEV